MVPTIQIRPDKMHVRSYLSRDGIHDEGLNLEAIQTGESLNPNDQDRGPQPLKPTKQLVTRRRQPTPIRCPGKPGGDDEDHGRGPRRTRRLVNHHRAYSAATTGTVAPHNTMLRRGHMTVTTTTLGRAPQDGS
jgi:hypothetical protein